MAYWSRCFFSPNRSSHELCNRKEGPGLVTLKEITNKNIWKICSLEPFEEQKDFVAENIQSLAEAYATRNEGNNALPLAVCRDEDLIGFVMIGKGTVGNEDESDLIKENYCLWRLMIDKKYQGQGWAGRRSTPSWT